MMGKLNIGTRTAVVGRHSAVNELTVHFIKNNEDTISGSNKACVPPSTNVSCKSCHGAWSRWRRLWVHHWMMRGTGRLVNSKCCSEREGRVVKRPQGRVWGEGW